MSNDLHTLSGAYALNALSSEEASEFRRHLAECAACRDEVTELRHAAARMGANETVAPPPYLKARVMAAADRTRQLPPPPTVETDQRAERSGATRSGGGATTSSPRLRMTSRLLLAAAAAVVVVAGAVGITQLGDEESQRENQLAAGVVRVFEADDANTATMETAIGGRISVATSPTLNEMAVDTDDLPPLDEGQVYQLWAIDEGSVASVGVLEPDQGAHMEMPGPDTEVAITVEPSGGSERPTSDEIMRVNPSSI